MVRTILGTGLMTAAACCAFGQAATAQAAFEVASVKSSELAKTGGDGSRREDISTGPQSVTMRNVRFRSCVLWAYDLMVYQVTGPAWINEERYDIAAKAAGPASKAQLREMMQRLLADRFQMVFHRETRELAAYILSVGKNGHKLHPSTTEGEADFRAAKQGKMNMIAERVSMARFAELLGDPLQRPVVDMTGLKGLFDFNLDLTAYVPPGGQDRPSEADAVSIVTAAVQEQLGLKLESRKSPIEMLVIDRAEKVASEN